MQGIGIWLLGALIGLLGLLGLFLASKAADEAMYIVGLIFFGYAVAFDGWLIRRSHDRPT
ncbi:MAG: hypothetical protein HYR63_01580 [Proteobacteria bacterium]|nr:hypothetical protein [Pseudomonadota bacterium]